MSRLAFVPRPSSASLSSASTRLTQIRGLLSSPSIRMDAVLESSEERIRVVAQRHYQASDTITPSNVSPSPIDQFRRWFSEALTFVREPEAMSVSTATPSGIPSSRFVLLKQVDSRGFVFFTNYNSRKSRELEENPYAALAFYWSEMHRQVRVVGRVERVTKEESEDYYRTRPLGSRIGAWASPQSSMIDEDELSKRFNDARDRFGVTEDQLEADIPLPDFWGGWRVIPFEVEFWAGKPSRLHDRVRYMRESESDVDWKIERLAP